MYQDETHFLVLKRMFVLLSGKPVTMTVMACIWQEQQKWFVEIFDTKLSFDRFHQTRALCQISLDWWQTGVGLW